MIMLLWEVKSLNRKLVLTLIFMAGIVCISCVSAMDGDVSVSSPADFNNDLNLSSEGPDIDYDNLPDTPLSPDLPDLDVNDTIYIDSANIDEYFPNGSISPECSNKTLLFSGNFENIGVLVVDVKNVTIKGPGAYLKNTVFYISGEGSTLSDLTLDLDSEFKENDYAAVLVTGDDVSLINLNVNYIVPQDTEAYGIYARGSNLRPIRNLKVSACNINFEGHNDHVSTYNCAVKLMNCQDAVVGDNIIFASLPLKDVNFGPDGATLDSDLVLAVGVEGCNNITVKDNYIDCEVNKRPGSKYPTLDCFLISKSDNSLIINNTINMRDFVTYPGTDNYIYGLDIYNLNNLTVTKNNIHIVTSGGKLAAGTAYPIQVTGPISGVNITDNDLYSFSNGPNIGIYSQNYYGETALSITKNRINVTGLAGVHEWALVAGIESQDSNSIIHSNIIEVHSVGDVGINDNIYGVSYRQSTSGNHTFDIQNNTVFSDGFYSVYLLSSLNSVIAGNTLVSFNENAKNGLDGYNYGDLSAHMESTFYNNRVIRAFDYFAGLNNNVDGGEEFNYETPSNNEEISNDINGKSIVGKDRNPYSYNPLIPGSSDSNGNIGGSTSNQGSNSGENSGNIGSDDSGSGVVPGGNSDSGEGTGGDSSSQGDSFSGGLSLRDILMNFINSNTDNGEVNTTSYNGNSRKDVVSNNTDATPSVDGSDDPVSESKSTASQSADAASPGQSSSVSKAYEIDENNDEALFIPSVFFVVAIVILLIVGYRRKNTKFD